MAEIESVKQSANLLRTIIRSIDKKLEYSLVDPTQEGRFSLKLTTRGREGLGFHPHRRPASGWS